MRFGGFAVGSRGPVVAYLRVSENDDLPGIGGICEDFLISGDGCIEDYFAGTFGGRTKTPALEDRSVFQSQDCRIQQFPPGDWGKNHCTSRRRTKTASPGQVAPLSCALDKIRDKIRTCCSDTSR